MLSKINIKISKDFALYALFCLLLAFVKINHELWFDEGQAWLIARDVGSYWELISQRLRYEGSTGMWHSILFVIARMGFSYKSIVVVSYLIAIAGGWILLKLAPFNRLCKYLLLFSYFFFYQYSVLARSYVLYLPLLLLLAHSYKDRFEKPKTFTFLSILISHVSLHGAMISVILFGQHMLDCWQERRSFNARMKRVHLQMMMIIIINSLFIAWQLWTPSDHTFAKRVNTEPVFLMNVMHDYLVNSITEHNWSSYIIIVLFLIITISIKRGLLFIGLLMPQLLLFAMKWSSPWHEGILFFIIVFMLWIAWDQLALKRMFLIQKIGSVGLASMLLVHIYWSAHSSYNDLIKPFSGSEAVANYIKSEFPNNDGKFFLNRATAISVVPYFEENIFDNLNSGNKPAYYPWSRSVDVINQSMRWIEDNDPDLLVVSLRKSRRNTPRSEPVYEGYRKIGDFPGYHFWKNRVYESAKYVVFARENENIALDTAKNNK